MYGPPEPCQLIINWKNAMKTTTHNTSLTFRDTTMPSPEVASQPVKSKKSPTPNYAMGNSALSGYAVTEKNTASGGPGLLWKIHEATTKDSKTPVSVWVCTGPVNDHIQMNKGPGLMKRSQ